MRIHLFLGCFLISSSALSEHAQTMGKTTPRRAAEKSHLPSSTLFKYAPTVGNPASASCRPTKLPALLLCAASSIVSEEKIEAWYQESIDGPRERCKLLTTALALTISSDMPSKDREKLNLIFLRLQEMRVADEMEVERQRRLLPGRRDWQEEASQKKIEMKEQSVKLLCALRDYLLKPNSEAPFFNDFQDVILFAEKTNSKSDSKSRIPLPSGAGFSTQTYSKTSSDERSPLSFGNPSTNFDGRFDIRPEFIDVEALTKSLRRINPNSPMWLVESEGCGELIFQPKNRYSETSEFSREMEQFLARMGAARQGTTSSDLSHLYPRPANQGPTAACAGMAVTSDMSTFPTFSPLSRGSPISLWLLARKCLYPISFLSTTEETASNSLDRQWATQNCTGHFRRSTIR